MRDDVHDVSLDIRMKDGKTTVDVKNPAWQLFGLESALFTMGSDIVEIDVKAEDGTKTERRTYQKREDMARLSEDGKYVVRHLEYGLKTRT